MEEWHHCPPTKQLLNHSRQLERELTKAKALLQKACAELPVSYYPDSTPEKLASNIAGFVKDYTENYRDLERRNEELTAHKVALGKCEIALHFMRKELAQEALSEIAKLQSTTP